MTESQPLHSTDTKTALLEAAKLLFSRRGFAAVTTREVADEARVNLGSIQYYFGSKGKLFIETIRYMMESEGHEIKEHVAVGECGNCKATASIKLSQFIKSFLHYLLVPEGPQPCRMMFREIFTETTEDPEMFEALVCTMSSEFAQPVEEMLSNLIVIIQPNASQAQVGANVRSIVGQCSFYVTHRPFQERLMGVCLADTDTIDEIAKHIAAFSLTGLGVDRATIDLALREIF